MVSNTSCEQDNLSIADIFLLNLFLTVVKNMGKMDTGILLQDNIKQCNILKYGVNETN
jgi:hypothetical protein